MAEETNTPQTPTETPKENPNQNEAPKKEDKGSDSINTQEFISSLVAEIEADDKAKMEALKTEMNNKKLVDNPEFKGIMKETIKTLHDNHNKELSERDAKIDALVKSVEELRQGTSKVPPSATNPHKQEAPQKMTAKEFYKAKYSRH
jgi:hypothetical protein